ncbi:MAG: hypothetical protein GWN00_16815 [Aliifodinibius sp.]|nr:hypothetical protein [Fodinibius sp.]NIV12704.1 hypothetical protein [Fodinibius sp.]NIY26404.1 hypothetical protein [Fodinibius sp.]
MIYQLRNILIAVGIMIMLISGCKKSTTNIETGNDDDRIPRSAYVINNLGQNLSVIKLDSNAVTADALPTGQIPNQILLRDTKAYVVNSGTNDLQVIDLEALSTIQTIDLGSGTNPYNMDFLNDSLAVVSLLLTNEVAIVNLNTAQVEDNISVGSSPEGVLCYQQKIYVANSGFNGSGYDPGKLSVIDVSNPNSFSVDSISTGLNPQHLAMDSQQKVIVACSGNFSNVSGQIDIVDASVDSVIQSIPVNIPITTVAVNTLDKAYLGTFGSGIVVYNLQQGTFERGANNLLPAGGPGIAFDAQNNAYFTDFAADSVHIYSEQHQHLQSYLVGDGPLSIAIYE